MGKLCFKVDYDFILVVPPHRKGIGLIFPNRDADKAERYGLVGATSLVQCGNANELGDAGGSPGKSSLFFLTSGAPWNQINWR